MKKLLGFLAAVTLATNGVILAVSCSNDVDDKKTDLSKVINVKDLGKLTDAKEATVKAALKAKNTTLNTDEIKLTITALKAAEVKNYTVIVEPKTDSTVYSGKVEGIKFNTETGVDDVKLSKSVIDDELANLRKNTYASNEDAIKAIKAVSSEGFEVKDATVKSADSVRSFADQAFDVTVVAKSGYVLDGFDGKTSVTLSIGKADVAVVRDTVVAELEKEVKDQEFASLQAAIDKVQTKSITGIKSITAVEKQARRSSEDKNLEVSVVAAAGYTLGDWDGKTVIGVKVTVAPTLKDLSTDLTVNALGELKDKSEATILAEIKTKNSNVAEAELVITDITDTGAKIGVKENSTVYNALTNPIQVTFTIKKADEKVKTADVKTAIDNVVSASGQVYE
ncbi:lipoprotein, partial [Mesoplasma melaleucae]